MRKYISIILAIILISFSVLLAVTLMKKKSKSNVKPVKISKTVSLTVVENKTIPLSINTTGSLVAKNKIELYSEVQGVLSIRSKAFKTGTYYKKGETILNINSEEFRANLRSMRSNFQNTLLSIMPDIKVDYSSEYEKWQTYLSAALEIEKTLPKLPEMASEQEKFFITAKNIYTQYYSVKTLEVKLAKHIIRAPYSGIVTETFVHQGSLIRQGQKLGEFISSNIYELELAVSTAFIDLIEIGKLVALSNIEQTNTWQGKVVRINGKIDQTSQTVKVFIEVRDKKLREGMYLEADLVAKSETNAFEVNRKLLVENDKLFAVEDSLLYLIEVVPVFFKEKAVIIKGLTDGTKLISKPLPGAFEGMKVKY